VAVLRCTQRDPGGWGLVAGTPRSARRKMGRRNDGARTHLRRSSWNRLRWRRRHHRRGAASASEARYQGFTLLLQLLASTPRRLESVKRLHVRGVIQLPQPSSPVRANRNPRLISVCQWIGCLSQTRKRKSALLGVCTVSVVVLGKHTKQVSFSTVAGHHSSRISLSTVCRPSAQTRLPVLMTPSTTLWPSRARLERFKTPLEEGGGGASRAIRHVFPGITWIQPCQRAASSRRTAQPGGGALRHDGRDYIRVYPSPERTTYVWPPGYGSCGTWHTPQLT
jgi:hypothetical protein